MHQNELRNIKDTNNLINAESIAIAENMGVAVKKKYNILTVTKEKKNTFEFK